MKVARQVEPSAIQSALLWAIALLVVCFGLYAFHPSSIADDVAPRLFCLKPTWTALFVAICFTALRMLFAVMLSIPLAFLMINLIWRDDAIGRLLATFINFGRLTPVVTFIALFSCLELNSALILATATILAIHMSRRAARITAGAPLHLIELCRALELTTWQTFWRCRAPVLTPALISSLAEAMPMGWMTLCGGEYLLAYLNNARSHLGLGSLINATLLSHLSVLSAVALVSVALLIVAFDTALLGPLLFWSQRFRLNDVASLEAQEEDAVYNFFHRRAAFSWAGRHIHRILLVIANFRFGGYGTTRLLKVKAQSFVYDVILPAVVIVVTGFLTVYFRGHTANWHAVAIAFSSVVGAAAIVSTAIILICGIWIPFAAFLQSQKVLHRTVSKVARLVNLYPTVLLLPILGHLMFTLDVKGFYATLMIVFLAGQWGCGAECIGLVQRFPPDLFEVARNLDVRGALWWKKVFLPGIAARLRLAAGRGFIMCWNLIIFAEFEEFSRGRQTFMSFGARLSESLLLRQSATTLLLSGLAITVVWFCVILFEGDVSDHEAR